MSCLYLSLIFPVWVLLCFCGFFPLFPFVSVFVPLFLQNFLPMYLSNILHPFTHAHIPHITTTTVSCLCLSSSPVCVHFLFLYLLRVSLYVSSSLSAFSAYPYSFSSKLWCWPFRILWLTPQINFCMFGIVFIPTRDMNCVIIAFADRCTRLLPINCRYSLSMI